MTLFNRAGAAFAGFVLVLCAWSFRGAVVMVARKGKLVYQAITD